MIKKNEQAVNTATCFRSSEFLSAKTVLISGESFTVGRMRFGISEFSEVLKFLELRNSHKLIKSVSHGAVTLSRNEIGFYFISSGDVEFVLNDDMSVFAQHFVNQC